jgi:hypothetical protein
MGRRPTPKHCIERINNDGNYEPGNCRWATKAEQNKNKSDARFITVNGVTKRQREWSLETGVREGLIGQRLRAGWPADLAVYMRADHGATRNARKKYGDECRREHSPTAQSTNGSD